MKGASLAYMNDQIRRSNRRQKVRGEKEFIVDSNMLLRDLKVKVIPQYQENFWIYVNSKTNKLEYEQFR